MKLLAALTFTTLLMGCAQPQQNGARLAVDGSGLHRVDDEGSLTDITGEATVYSIALTSPTCEEIECAYCGHTFNACTISHTITIQTTQGEYETCLDQLVEAIAAKTNGKWTAKP